MLTLGPVQPSLAPLQCVLARSHCNSLSPSSPRALPPLRIITPTNADALQHARRPPPPPLPSTLQCQRERAHYNPAPPVPIPPPIPTHFDDIGCITNPPAHSCSRPSHPHYNAEEPEHITILPRPTPLPTPRSRPLPITMPTTSNALQACPTMTAPRSRPFLITMVWNTARTTTTPPPNPAPRSLPRPQPLPAPPHYNLCNIVRITILPRPCPAPAAGAAPPHYNVCNIIRITIQPHLDLLLAPRSWPFPITMSTTSYTLQSSCGWTCSPLPTLSLLQLSVPHYNTRPSESITNTPTPFTFLVLQSHRAHHNRAFTKSFALFLSTSECVQNS